MSHLLRGSAPITDAGWAAIEEEAKSRLTTWLAGRRLVDVSGPTGWETSATNLGRTKPLDGGVAGVEIRQRQILPYVELRAPFDVSRDELDALDRGALDIDFGPLDEAANQLALAENGALFEGLPSAGLTGIREAANHPGVQLSADFNEYPKSAAVAITALERAGIGGPYALAIGPDGYTGIIETAENGGYPLLDHLKQILDGPVVWAPGLVGGLVVSIRGGDLLLELGQDISIGYTSHDAAAVHLYFEESFTFRVLEPDAAVALLPA